MTNLEMIKKFDKENMAMTIMCPYEAGLTDSYRCKENGVGVVDGNCKKCIFDWLGEEAQQYFVGDRVVFLLFQRQTLGVITKIDKEKVWVDAGAGELELTVDSIIETFE